MGGSEVRIEVPPREEGGLIDDLLFFRNVFEKARRCLSSDVAIGGEISRNRLDAAVGGEISRDLFRPASGSGGDTSRDLEQINLKF